MSEKDNVFDYVMNSPEDTNPSVLRSLLNDIPEGTQELPTPSASSVGKVATVVSDGQGGYEWGAETSSGGVLFVTATMSFEDEGDYYGSFTIDKTIEELNAAYSSGKRIVLIADFSSFTHAHYVNGEILKPELLQFSENQYGTRFTWAYTYYGDDEWGVYEFHFAGSEEGYEGTIQYYYIPIYNIPT